MDDLSRERIAVEVIIVMEIRLSDSHLSSSTVDFIMRTESAEGRWNDGMREYIEHFSILFDFQMYR